MVRVYFPHAYQWGLVGWCTGRPLSGLYLTCLLRGNPCSHSTFILPFGGVLMRSHEHWEWVRVLLPHHSLLTANDKLPLLESMLAQPPINRELPQYTCLVPVLRDALLCIHFWQRAVGIRITKHTTFFLEWERALETGTAVTKRRLQQRPVGKEKYSDNGVRTRLANLVAAKQQMGYNFSELSHRWFSRWILLGSYSLGGIFSCWSWEAQYLLWRQDRTFVQVVCMGIADRNWQAGTLWVSC